MRRIQNISNPSFADKLTVILVCLFAIIALILVLQTRTNTQDWQNWVEMDSHERQEFEKFQSMFGSNDYVIASWPKCVGDDPRLKDFAEMIRHTDPHGFIERIVTGPEAEQGLASQWNGFDMEQARRRLKHVFFSESQHPEIEMLRYGSRPVVFAMLTSAIGVGSLTVSRVPAVSQFGGYSAIAIMVGLILLLTILPTSLRLFGMQQVITGRYTNQQLGRARAFVFAIATHKPLIPAISMGFILVMGGLGLVHLRSNLDSGNLFSPNSKFTKDRLWFESEGFANETVELVVSFDNLPENETHLQVRSLLFIQGRLLQDPRITTSMSVASLIHRRQFPALTHDVTSTTYRTSFNDGLEKQRQELETSDLLSVVGNTWFWRITVFCNANEQLDFAMLIEDCKSMIDELDLPTTGNVTLTATGLTPIARQGHHKLFGDLARSFLLALAIITPWIMMLLRSILGGIVAMIPNLFPAVVFLGC